MVFPGGARIPEAYNIAVNPAVGKNNSAKIDMTFVSWYSQVVGPPPYKTLSRARPSPTHRQCVDYLVFPGGALTPEAQ